MANLKRLTQLANYLERYVKDPNFDMNHFCVKIGSYIGYIPGINKPFPKSQKDAYNCNTAGCIAGWAVFRFAKERKIYNEIYADAKNYLDLSITQANKLFYGKFPYFTEDKLISQITRLDAVKALRILIEEVKKENAQNNPI